MESGPVLNYAVKDRRSLFAVGGMSAALWLWCVFDFLWGGLFLLGSILHLQFAEVRDLMAFAFLLIGVACLAWAFVCAACALGLGRSYGSVDQAIRMTRIAEIVSYAGMLMWLVFFVRDQAWREGDRIAMYLFGAAIYFTIPLLVTLTRMGLHSLKKLEL